MWHLFIPQTNTWIETNIFFSTSLRLHYENINKICTFLKLLLYDDSERNQEALSPDSVVPLSSQLLEFQSMIFINATVLFTASWPPYTMVNVGSLHLSV